MKMSCTGLVAAAALGLLVASCGSTEDGGAEILPDVSPVNLGKFWPLGNNTPEYGSPERVPYEYVMLLQSTGETTLTVNKACLVGDAGTLNNWILEGPVPKEIPAGTTGAIRLSFERPGVGRDVLAVVVESNADNFPQMVVPVCAEVVADGADRTNAQPCEYTEEIPANPCG